MKKLFLVLFAAALTLTTYSCRETTEENTEAEIEEVGNDVESDLEEAGNDIEQSAEEVEQEVEQEVNETDDMQ